VKGACRDISHGREGVLVQIIEEEQLENRYESARKAEKNCDRRITYHDLDLVRLSAEPQDAHTATRLG